MRKCDICRVKEGTIRIREIEEDGELKIKYICKDCAIKRGIIMSDKKSFIEILDDFFKEVREEDEKIVCSTCGTTLLDFKTTGLFGCPDCYTSFSQHIGVLFSILYGDNQYKGSAYPEGDYEIWKKHIKDYLKMKLDEAIGKENYEYAARIRDILKEMGEA